MSLGRGMRRSSQRYRGVLPVVRVISRVMRGLGLSLRHTQQLGITHPLCVLPLVSVARGQGHVGRAQTPGIQTILQRVTMTMGYGGQSGGPVSISGRGELPPVSWGR